MMSSTAMSSSSLLADDGNSSFLEETINGHDTLASNNIESSYNGNIPMIPIIEEENSHAFNDEFNNRQNNCRKYAYSILRLLVVDILIDYISADNTSIVSKTLRTLITVFSYSTYVALTGHLLWGIAYLLDHHWWVLAISGSVTLLLVSTFILAVYEWMWRWQAHAGRRITSGRQYVIVQSDDEDEDDLSLRAWLKQYSKWFGYVMVWWMYCILNIKIDFWITDMYIMGRPEHHKYELYLVNCIEAFPVLCGSALFMYYAYPPFYYWHCPPSPARTNENVTLTATVPTTITAAGDPSSNNNNITGGLQLLL
jgi:hypothetical protein